MTSSQEAPSIVRKTETALDDLLDLWRRRRPLSIIVLLIIVAPLLVSVVAIPRLRSQLKDAQGALDKAEIRLAPFLAAANSQFPSAEPEKRLELLATKIERLESTVAGADKKMDSVVDSVRG